MLVMAKEQRADILVTAEQGQPLLIVEVKRRPLDQSVRHQLTRYSQAVGADFVMGIDPQHIVVAKTRNGLPDWDKAIKLSTKDVLSNYANVQDLEQVEEFYLESLIQAWLRDFSFSWKSQSPPGFKELAAIGLAARLRNSETHTRST